MISVTGIASSLAGSEKCRIREPFLTRVGYDWKWDKTEMSAVTNWSNMTNKFYQPANQEVGLPERVTGTMIPHFRWSR